MLAVTLKIVSILGIILLVLLCIVIAFLLIVLFIPIVYRLDAEKNTESIRADFKLRWLFGLLRAGYSYPEPGRILVKVLWFTVFDSGKKTEQPKKRDKKKKKASESADTKTTAEQKTESQNAVSPNQGTQNTDAHNTDTLSTDPQEETSSQKEKLSVEKCQTGTDSSENHSTERKSKKSTEQKADENTSEHKAGGNASEHKTDENSSVFAEASKHEKKTLREKLFAKYEKIKYTILNIYDKIKHIFENLSFYKKLLQDEETKLLFSHTCRRIGKIWHHIRPRRIEADVTFGTGEPDTTGYAYAVYGMLSPNLGKAVCVTPDFTQAILEGSLHAAGHITVFTLLINLLAVLLDRRLRLFIRRIKAHANKAKAVPGSKTA